MIRERCAISSFWLTNAGVVPAQLPAILDDLCLELGEQLQDLGEFGRARTGLKIRNPDAVEE